MVGFRKAQAGDAPVEVVAIVPSGWRVVVGPVPRGRRLVAVLRPEVTRDERALRAIYERKREARDAAR